MKDRHDIQVWVEKIRRRLFLDRMPKWIRIVIVTVMGGLCVIGGIIMLVTPGPGLLFIPLGLLLLAGEFECAGRWAQTMMDACDKARAKWRAYRERRASAAKSNP